MRGKLLIGFFGGGAWENCGKYSLEGVEKYEVILNECRQNIHQRF